MSGLNQIGALTSELMKALSLNEVQQIVIDLQALVGAQLQEIYQSGDNVALGFYHDRALLWLWFDLNAVAPTVVRLDKIPKLYRKEIKPLTLFIRSHFSGSRLQSITTSPDLGRVFEMHFVSGVLQARLFPRGQNFIASAQSKSVSLEKVKELLTSTVAEEHLEIRESRSWEQIENEWKIIRKVDPSQKPSSSSINHLAGQLAQAEKQFKKDIEKKEKALQKMKEDLANKQNPIFRGAGEFLKTLLPAEFPQSVPQEFLEAIDKEATLSENIESLFKKAKDNERKTRGTLERVTKLEAEINDLRIRGPQVKKEPLTPSGQKRKTLLEAASVRGRKFQVANDLEAYIGKSASDNLALLRKAQPFDYWLHLRDYPGTHAILRRTRHRVVSDGELQQVGKWVVQQSLHKTPEQLVDTRFDVLLVECRYVRPIKGDKLGRVNYTNDRVFVVRF